MLSKVEQNKQQKEKSLYNAAYKLFTTKGIHSTAINDIVKEAGVAKGTFYLYFKNKYDILDKIILDKSAQVLTEAMNETESNYFNNFEEEVLFFIDFIIEYLKYDKRLLKLIYKNLSWGIFRRAYEDYSEMQKIFTMFERGFQHTEIDKKDIANILFIVLELTGSVCYSCIILNEPTNIDEMKPILFEAIRRIL